MRPGPHPQAGGQEQAWAGWGLTWKTTVMAWYQFQALRARHDGHGHGVMACRMASWRAAWRARSWRHGVPHGVPRYFHLAQALRARHVSRTKRKGEKGRGRREEISGGSEVGKGGNRKGQEGVVEGRR